MELPTALVPASTGNPSLLVIYAKPKLGKTALLAQLPNSLLIDLENGSDFVSAFKMKAGSTDEISQILRLVRKANDPVRYRYGILDTITALEEMCVPLAERIYSETGQGKNWFLYEADGKTLSPNCGKSKYGTILDIPEGYGYRWLREALFKVVDAMRETFPVVILVGHVKEVILDKGGSNVNSLDLDLTGKIKKMITFRADAVGYLYRGKNNQNILSFKTNDEIACGVRPEHLSNQEIVVSEKDKDTGVLTTYWDRIFVDEIQPPAPAAVN